MDMLIGGFIKLCLLALVVLVFIGVLLGISAFVSLLPF